MSFDWTEYLGLAQELTSSTTASSVGIEAKSRSAISRAYYAAFCQSRNYLRDVEGKSLPKNADVHRVVKKDFVGSADTVRKSIGKNLDRLRIERNKADYDDRVVSISTTTSFAVALAQTVIADLNKL